MEESNYRNEFKFVLRQGDVVLAEKVFNADSYSPLTRSFIDVRGIFLKLYTDYKMFYLKQYIIQNH